jgi:hypothetical protein
MMKPHGFWWTFEISAGSMVLLWLVVLILVIWGASEIATLSHTDILTIALLFLALGLLCGLIVGLIYRPVTRSFSFNHPANFRLDLEHKLADRGFIQHSQSEGQLIYRCSGLSRLFLPDLSLEIGAKSARLTGPRSVIKDL